MGGALPHARQDTQISAARSGRSAQRLLTAEDTHQNRDDGHRSEDRRTDTPTTVLPEGVGRRDAVDPEDHEWGHEPGAPAALSGRKGAHSDRKQREVDEEEHEAEGERPYAAN